MDGNIRIFLNSNTIGDKQAKEDMFHPDFQKAHGWIKFLNKYLHGGQVGIQLGSGAKWNVRSFQALYIACWLHHPVEKGTYMINLSKIPGAYNRVEDAIKTEITGKGTWIGQKLKGTGARPSSHLSGKGYSASRDWAFIKGYHELLVQLEWTEHARFLMLKCEGHDTGILSGAIPHALSYLYKLKHSKGKTANESHNKFAINDARGLVDERAAENYGKGYNKLVKALGFSGRMATVRDVLHELFERTGFVGSTAVGPKAQSNNRLLGRDIEQYVHDHRRLPIPAIRRLPESDQNDIFDDLIIVAKTLVADGEGRTARVFTEVRALPAEIDASIAKFKALEPGKEFSEV